jgi:hypothetical protein
VKLLLQSWRYAVPVPADAILAHLKVQTIVRSALLAVPVQACLTARPQKLDWQQCPTMHVQASVTATEKEGNRTALQLRTAGQNRRIVGMKLLSAGGLCSGPNTGVCLDGRLASQLSKSPCGSACRCEIRAGACALHCA